VNVIEALEAAGIEVHRGSNEDEINICCPFCLEEGESSLDERFRLGINIRTGKAQCFNCQKRAGGGDWIFKELQRVLDTGDIEAAQESRKHKKSNGHIELPKGFQEFSSPYCEKHDYFYKKAYHYIRHRKITDRQLKEKHIGYSIVDDDFAYRIIFPAYVKGKLRGIVGRDFTGDAQLKYKNSIGDKTLYNYPDHPQKTVVLSESAIPALVIERASKKLDMDSLGLLGHSLTDSQLELLEPYRRILVWLDPDEAGVKGAVDIAKKLTKDKIVKLVLPKWYFHAGAKDVDPDELEIEVIGKRLLAAERFTEAMEIKLRARMAFDED
jgi:hypothetical protein